MSLVKVPSTNVTIFEDFWSKSTLKIQNVFSNDILESEKT